MSSIVDIAADTCRQRASEMTDGTWLIDIVRDVTVRCSKGRDRQK
jgi:hypothetical protein